MWATQLAIHLSECQYDCKRCAHSHKKGFDRKTYIRCTKFGIFPCLVKEKNCFLKHHSKKRSQKLWFRHKQLFWIVVLYYIKSKMISKKENVMQIMRPPPYFHVLTFESTGSLATPKWPTMSTKLMFSNHLNNKWHELVLKRIISSWNKSFLKNALYLFEGHWVINCAYISGTANAINMDQKLVKMISKFEKHQKVN